MEMAENLSQTSKRTVGRRKAAEKSEKKWKEAMEEDQTYEALPDVFLGTCLGIPEIPKDNSAPPREPPISTPPPTDVTPTSAMAVSPPAPPVCIGGPSIQSLTTDRTSTSAMAVAPTPSIVSPPIHSASVASSPLEIPKVNKPHTHKNIGEYKDSVTLSKANGLDRSFTVLEDSILKEVVDHLACVTCCTKSLNTLLSKNAKGRTDEIRVCCTNCNSVIFQRFIPQVLPPRTNSKNFTSSTHGEYHSESLKRKSGEGEGNNVEQLVCDVDVMKDEQNKEAEQAHYDPVKMKKNDYWNHSESYSDENYYYMWQDISSMEAQHQELVPCNTLYRPNKKRKPRSEFQYQFWKKEDEDTILNYFTDMIKAMKVPGKDACREFLSKNPDIKTDWTRVKYKVYNQIQKHKKKMKKE